MRVAPAEPPACRADSASARWASAGETEEARAEAQVEAQVEEVAGLVVVVVEEVVEEAEAEAQEVPVAAAVPQS